MQRDLQLRAKTLIGERKSRIGVSQTVEVLTDNHSATEDGHRQVHTRRAKTLIGLTGRHKGTGRKTPVNFA